jgi:hypothetical protein
MVDISHFELTNAFLFSSAGSPGEGTAYIDLDTGTIYLVSDYIDRQEDVPEDIQTSECYLAIPHKNEFNLGRRLVMCFCAEKLSDDDYEKVEDIFRRKGAYSRFKDFLDRKNLLGDWYAYEEKATEQALREWCEDNGITIIPEIPPR